MDESDWLAERFEAHRTHLRAVAYRMLGSPSEADDAVQEAWIRLSRADSSGIENLRAWLTTVVARVCLNMLQSRRWPREKARDAHLPEPAGDPIEEALLAESVGLALQVVLDTLSPRERVAFVLHDLFGVPFPEIAPIVGGSPAAARQLASRARRRMQGASVAPEADLARQREVVAAFFAASRDGDFEALIAVLDPDVVLRADRAAMDLAAARGGPRLSRIRGAQAVAATFSGRAGAARLALVDGAIGAVWTPGGRPRVVFAFTVAGGRISAIDIAADPEYVSELDLTILEDAGA